MSQSNFQPASTPLASPSTSIEMAQTRKRLIQEISCLERQLVRLRKYNQYPSNATCETYEEMIYSRQEMLASLA